jgi:hypothetical protein
VILTPDRLVNGLGAVQSQSSGSRALTRYIYGTQLSTGTYGTKPGDTTSGILSPLHPGGVL